MARGRYAGLLNFMNRAIKAYIDDSRRSRRLKWPFDPALPLAFPGLFYLSLVFAIPLVLLLLSSLSTPEGISLVNYTEFFSEPFHWKVMWNTLRAALLTTLFSLLIGYPTAFALARSSGLLQIVLIIALILPLSVGVVVKAFSWTILLRSDGLVNQAMIFIGLIDEPVRLLFTPAGLVFGAINIFVPFMVLPIYSVVKLMDRSLLDAAATLGSSPLHRFFHVTVPLTMPGVIAGIAFVFSLSVAMYVVPTLLIGERYQTMSMLIARSYLYLRDRALGSTMAMVLLSIAVATVLASSYLTRNRQEG